MRTLEQAIAERMAEKAEAERKRALAAEKERREIAAKELWAANLMREFLEEVYDVELDSLTFVARVAGSGFEISVDLPGGQARLLNDMYVANGEVRVYPLRVTDSMVWRACQHPDNYYVDRRNFLDAIIYLRGINGKTED
jgi:hypothetical protein